MISRIHHFIFDHALLKLMSLIIAVLMWYGVARDPVSEVALRVPVEFSRAPQSLDYISDVLPQAQILLRGPARVLRDVAPESVHLAVDLQGATPGEHTYDLAPNQVRVPHGIEVMQVTPTRLRLVFDKRETRQVTVQAACGRHTAAWISHCHQWLLCPRRSPSPARRAMLMPSRTP